MADPGSEESLFKEVRYYVIGVLDNQIEKLLADGKAKQEAYLSGLATHAIVTDYANLEVEEARDVWQIPAVTVKWVELSQKCNKLLPAEAFTPSNSLLFSGLVFCPSQLKKGDINLLWALCTFHGGSCQVTLNKSCTHLVTPTPKGAKYEEASKHSEIITIVTLDWILDSVKKKLLEDATRYHPSCAILPQKKPEPSESIVPDTQTNEPDTIASSLEAVTVSATEQASQSTTRMTVATASQGETKTPAMVQMAQAIPASVPANGIPVSIQGPVGQGVISSPLTQSLQPGVTMTQSEREVYPFGQAIIPQTGQQYILTGQSIGQVQRMHQFQMQQRQATPGATPRLPGQTGQQRFPSPSQPSSTQKQSTTTTKKTPQRRRRSSAKSKANAAATTASVPSPSVHTNQIVTMSQQQFLQQQNQQMLISQHRMMMQQQQQAGLGGKVGFMQPQQMYQNQHFASLQGKAQVPPTSPQKQPQHMMTEQVQGGMRPFLQGNYPGNAMRIQQPQQRPMQVQTQMSPQQMMAMGLNPQIQFQQQQQQVKMSGLGQQQQPQFNQPPQQGVIIQRGMQMQATAQGLNQAKLQPQRMQVSPQQQGMYMQRHVTKEGVAPRQPLQQHSPMKQQPQAVTQQQAQLQMQTPITPQQQQIMMQQMAHQRQLQMQLTQAPNQIPTQQQKQTPPPTSHAPINVGIGVISPTALQQGLMMAQAQQNQGFQAPLVHPSLQTPQDYGKVTPQSSTTKSRRSKTRKPKDGDENAESKPKAKSRSRSKKSSQSPASASSSPGGKKLSQNSPSITGIAAYYQTPLNVMTPPPHPTVPVAFSVNKPAFVTPTATVSPLAATENTFGPSHILQNTARMEQSPQPNPKVETRFLPQHTPTPTPPLPRRGPFNDPLAMVPKSYEGKYFGHDPAENVPQDLCLLGCVFVIIEYQDTVQDLKIIEHWKKVINKFGGIVEEEYNTCTCTHIMCISQTTSLFKDALLEGKRCVTVYWLNDVLHIRKLEPPWLAIHIPTPFSAGQKPAVHHAISYTGFHQKERERLRMMANICGCKFSGFLSRSNTVLVCKGTLSLKYDKAREWRIPCVSVHWLRGILQGDTEALNDPGQSKYQNFDEKCPDLFSLDETKAQKILDPWRVPVRVTLDCMQRAGVKRKSSVPDASAPALKRSRIEGSYQPLPRVCFTGLPTKQVAELQKTLESLQGQTSKSISLSTHLVAKCVSRTVKFLCAISVCQYIVTPEWIEESGKSNWLLDEDKYLLNDKSAEEKFSFSLKESLKRARATPLFQGYVFCITENVAPDRKILTEIVECAGGKVIKKIPPIPELKRLQNRKVPNNQLLLISCPADEEHVIKWKREGIQVHNAEIILTGVLKQEVNITAHQL